MQLFFLALKDSFPILNQIYKTLSVHLLSDCKIAVSDYYLIYLLEEYEIWAMSQRYGAFSDSLKIYRLYIY